MDENAKKIEKAKKSLQSMSNQKSPKQIWQWGEALNSLKRSQDYKDYLKKIKDQEIHFNFFNQDEENNCYDDQNCLESFYQYLKKEIQGFYISKEYVCKYIKIYEEISEQDLENNPNMLIAHLYTLINVNQETRRLILQAMSEIEKEYKTSPSVQHRTLKSLYRENDIEGLLTGIKKKYKNFSVKDFKTIIYNDCIRTRILTNTKKNAKNKWGIKNLNTYYFNELQNLHPKEPVDEQSFIGLFCTMFYLLKRFTFQIPEQEWWFQFSKIVYIRTKFPDAKIEFNIYESQQQSNCIGDKDLDIEFEYASQNYTGHNHQNQGSCDLIICWENNWNSPAYYAPILSLKELLETGKINIKYFN